LLTARFNPSIVDTLADEADLAREIWEWMTAAAAAYQGSVGSDELDVEMLMAAPMALRRLIVWEAMRRTARGRPVGLGHVEAALRLMETGGSIDAPAHRVERVGDRLVLTGRVPGTKGRAPNLFRYPLSIPGEASFPKPAGLSRPRRPDRGATVGNEAIEPAAPGVAIVRGALCRGPLSVRNRRPGDRFAPVGLGGRQEAAGFFRGP
jgi:hypothetical protein